MNLLVESKGEGYCRGVFIENRKHSKMLESLGQAWQRGRASDAQTSGRATDNKLRLYSSL